MSKRLTAILYLLFFVSGFCGLLYQVVWLRLAFAAYGIITPVMSIVISVFMLGLAIGSFVGGRWIVPLTRRLRVSAILFYAAAEILIGAGAFMVPVLFAHGTRLLFNIEQMNSVNYLLFSGAVIAAAMLPWCVMMGLTFPFMMAFIRENQRDNNQSFSFLYQANVLGAITGTLLTAYVLVELYGFRMSSYIAALCNFSIALTSILIGIRHPFKAASAAVEAAPAPAAPLTARPMLTLVILFTTGFSSMAMEVVWIRAYTIIFGNTIYAFAAILAAYLAATWIGSYYYRKHLSESAPFDTSKLVATLAAVSFFPVLLNDPRIAGNPLMVILSIIPFCAVLGYLTPKLIDEYSGGGPKEAARAYAINVIGCILGPLIVSYFTLPVISLRFNMIVLALPFATIFYYIRKNAQRTDWFVTMGIITASFIYFTLTTNLSYEEYFMKQGAEIRRDYASTVASTTPEKDRGDGKQLIVNGIPVTVLTGITKHMAHIPLLFTEGQPRSALVICFGMGTTYRSLMSWGIDVTAVELMPSVVDAFGYYHKDAGEILKNPNGHILVDDGRRFLARTKQTFDVITLDHSPPIEGAGVSLILSEEFYELAKKHLNDGGVLHQWFHMGEDKILYAMTRAIVKSFPYVKVYKSLANRQGFHFIASMKPIKPVNVAEFVKKMPQKAQEDLVEWFINPDTESIIKQIFDFEFDIRYILKDDKRLTITDDRPFNEYYFIRRAVAKINGTYVEVE
ncbi:MAG: hypothetical protein HQK95_01835 [Nitrospirae bacterium]|nr:hypothetical protein [Nitrospirota bacterium]